MSCLGDLGNWESAGNWPGGVGDLEAKHPIQTCLYTLYTIYNDIQCIKIKMNIDEPCFVDM